MKHLAVLFLLSFFTLSITAQNAIDKDADWKVGEVKIFKENKIKRIEGANSGHTITNITYRDLKQLIDEVNDGSLRGDAKKKQIKKHKDYAQGGIVVFYINRESANAANLKNYTLIAKDNSRKELYKRVYKDRPAKENAKNGGWSNSKNFELKVEVEKPFTIEIQEKLSSGKTANYIFEISE
ncbi:MAG: hypothetical protein J5I47_11485 [Vicingus serpentipes]|nr:hypothetical protein [Vicingus serpentipes]